MLTEKDKFHIEKTKGNVLGRAVLDHIKVLKNSHKEKDVEGRVEKEMEKIGYSIDISKLKDSEKIPISYYMAFFVVEKNIFNLDDEGVREIGRSTARSSFLVRFASKYLISLEMLSKNSQVAWDKYYKGEGGRLDIIEASKEKKILTGDLYDFWGHPIHCRYLEGYFEQVVSLVNRSKVVCREEKCAFDGEVDFHRFTAKWE